MTILAGDFRLPVPENLPPLLQREDVALHGDETRVVLSLWRGLMTVTACRGSITEIARVVAERHGVTVDDLRGRSRCRGISWARFELMWILNRWRGLSLCRIATYLNLRDHTGVLYGVRRHDQRIALALGETAAAA